MWKDNAQVSQSMGKTWRVPLHVYPTPAHAGFRKALYSYSLFSGVGFKFYSPENIVIPHFIVLY